MMASPKESPAEDAGDSEGESTEEEYGDVLADILKVPEADREDFISALQGYVRACIEKESA